MRGLLAIERMYHQIIAGNKTQTRRSGGLDRINGCKEVRKNGKVIKEAIITHPDNWEITGYTGEMGGDLSEVDFCDYMDTQRNIYIQPRYKVGEVLYLKEPYQINVKGEVMYKFNHRYHSACEHGRWWKNKLFMPASAARAFIRITGIKCERLLDISDEDCLAEGIETGYSGNHPFGYINYLMHEGYGYDYIDNTPKESFISLFKLANKLAKVGSVPPHGSLPTPPDVENIWVWAYTFQYLKDYKLNNN